MEIDLVLVFIIIINIYIYNKNGDSFDISYIKTISNFIIFTNRLFSF